MKKLYFLPRFLALWLILSLSLPNPALALRTGQKAQNEAGMEELKNALRSDDPAGHLMQLASAVLTTPASVSPVPTPATVRSEFPLAAAGAEEGGSGLAEQVKFEMPLGAAVTLTLDSYKVSINSVRKPKTRPVLYLRDKTQKVLFASAGLVQQAAESGDFSLLAKGSQKSALGTQTGGSVYLLIPEAMRELPLYFPVPATPSKGKFDVARLVKYVGYHAVILTPEGLKNGRLRFSLTMPYTLSGLGGYNSPFGHVRFAYVNKIPVKENQTYRLSAGHQIDVVTHLYDPAAGAEERYSRRRALKLFFWTVAGGGLGAGGAALLSPSVESKLLQPRLLAGEPERVFLADDLSPAEVHLTLSEPGILEPAGARITASNTVVQQEAMRAFRRVLPAPQPERHWLLRLLRIQPPVPAHAGEDRPIRPEGTHESLVLTIQVPEGVSRTVLRFRLGLARPFDGRPGTGRYDELNFNIRTEVNPFARAPVLEASVKPVEARLVTVGNDSNRTIWPLLVNSHPAVVEQWFLSVRDDLDWAAWDKAGDMQELELTFEHPPNGRPFYVTLYDSYASRTQWYQRRQEIQGAVMPSSAGTGAVLGAVTGLAVAGYLTRLKKVPAAGAEERELQQEMVALLKLKHGRDAVRNGKWAELIGQLEQNEQTHLEALFTDPRKILAERGQTWKEKGLIKGGGAEKLLASDIAETKRRASQRLERKRTEEAKDLAREQERKKATDREAQVRPAQLVFEGLVPALRRLAESDLTDFSELRKVRNLWPDREQLWLKVVDEAEALVRGSLTAQQDEGHVELFMQIIQHLDDRWLAEQGVLVFPAVPPARMGSARQVADLLAVGRIETKQVYELQERRVPAYFVEVIFPKNVQHQPVGWYPTGMIILSRQALAATAEFPWKFHGGSGALDRAVSRIFAVVRQYYASPDEVQRFLEADSLFEELRHGLDFTRVERQAGRSYGGLDIHFQERFIAHQIRPEGHLRAMWDHLGEIFPTTGVDGENVKALHAHALFEISGQMTAAAAGTNPRYSVAKWLQVNRMAAAMLGTAVFEQKGYQIAVYNTAALLAIHLIAHELGMTEAPSNPSGWLMLTNAQVASLSEAIIEEPPERIRLAMKAVYEHEFVDPIDEPPFPGIAQDGSLIARASTSAAGTEERDLNSISADDLANILIQVLGVAGGNAKQLADQIIQKAPFRDWSQFRGAMKERLSKEQITAIKQSGLLSISKPKKAAPTPKKDDPPLLAYWHHIADAAERSYVKEGPLPGYVRLVPDDMVRGQLNLVPQEVLRYLGLSYIWTVPKNPKEILSPGFMNVRADTQVLENSQPVQRRLSFITVDDVLQKNVDGYRSLTFDGLAIPMSLRDAPGILGRIHQASVLHEVGEILWHTLPAPFQEEWGTIYRRGGYIYERNLQRVALKKGDVTSLKGGRAFENLDEMKPEEVPAEVFADSFAFFFGAQTFYKDMNQPVLTVAENAFMQKVLEWAKRQAEHLEPLPGTYAAAAGEWPGWVSPSEAEMISGAFSLIVWPTSLPGQAPTPNLMAAKLLAKTFLSMVDSGILIKSFREVSRNSHQPGRAKAPFSLEKMDFLLDHLPYILTGDPKTVLEGPRFAMRLGFFSAVVMPTITTLQREGALSVEPESREAAVSSVVVRMNVNPPAGVYHEIFPPQQERDLVRRTLEVLLKPEPPPPAAGVEETSAVSAEVAEGMARVNDFLGRIGSDPSLLFGAGIHDLTESFGKSPEIEAFEREGVRPLLLVLPDRLSLPGGSLESPTLKLLVEPKYERAIREQLSFALTSGIVEITSDPSAARFVIGGRDFIQNQKENRLVSRDATFLQVDPSTVGSLTQDSLAMLFAYKPGAVLVVGTQVEHADAVVLFESA